ncbi:unnamed protein product [Sphagnum balticum]
MTQSRIHEAKRGLQLLKKKMSRNGMSREKAPGDRQEELSYEQPFNTQAIQKHEKICEKVFQSKRKAFDSSAHRQPEVEDFKPPVVSKNDKKKAK